MTTDNDASEPGERLPASPDGASRGARIRRRLTWAAGTLAVLAGLWTLAVGQWLPGLLKPRLEAAASQALGAPLAIGRIDIGPWSLAAHVQDLRLGPADAPWLTVAAIEADVSSESLWRLAPVLSRLTVRAPQVRLERQTAERWNISPMLDALARRPPSPPDAAPARFALHNIRLEDGALRFDDRVAVGSHRIEALRLGVPFIANLSSAVAVDVEPLLEARVDGSALRLAGRAQPFSAGQRSAVQVQWQGIDLARLLGELKPLLPALPLALDRGTLSLNLQLAFERLPAPALPALRITGEAALAQPAAQLPAQGLTLALQQVVLRGLDLQPLLRQAVVGTVQLDQPAVVLDLAALDAAPPGGQSPASAPTPDAAASSAASSAAMSAAPVSPPAGAAPPAWQWRVDAVRLADGSLKLRAPAWPDGQALTALQLNLDGLRADDVTAPATLALQATDSLGATLKADGRWSLSSGQGQAHLALAGLHAAAWLAPWQARLPLRVDDGQLTLDLQARRDAKGWALQDGTLQLAGVKLRPGAAAPGQATGRAPAAAAVKAARPATTAKPAGPDDLLTLDRLAATGIALRADDGQPPDAAIASLRLDGLNLKASRDARGQLPWLAPLATATGQPAPGPKARPAPAAAGPHWRLDELRCTGCSVALADRSVSPAAALALTRTDLRLQHLHDDPRQPLAFALTARTGSGGSVDTRGSVKRVPLALDATLALADIDLALLQPYLEPYLNLTLQSAKAGAKGRLKLDGDASGTPRSATWRGALALTQVKALDRVNAADFVRLAALRLDDSTLDWRADAAPRIALGQVSLDDFYGRVILNPDGRLNLKDIVRSAGQDARSLTTPNAPGAPAATTAAPASAPAPAASTPAPAAPPAAPLALRWQGIAVHRGQVDFTDLLIRPNYSARLTDVAGTVSSLAWDDPQPAQVRIDGKVDGSAPLRIEGTVHPLGARLHTDITASARGIDITRLSTYAARYAGYGIDRGTLSATVHYRIDGGKLQADNRLVIDKLGFGAPVEGPDVKRLPVQLAVALLSDRNGVIDINLPVGGSLDDPQFSIGSLVWQVIVNVITKAVTAPFSLLASAFGGGGDDAALQRVPFAPGSAEPSPDGLAALDKLATALEDRPALKLEITGRADPQADAQALAEANAAATTATPAPATASAPSPVQAARPAAAASTPAVSEAALRELADRRAAIVKAHLASRVAPERLLVIASALVAAGNDDRGSTSRVDLALKQ